LLTRRLAGSSRSTSSDCWWHRSPARDARNFDLTELIRTRNLSASNRYQVRASIEP
jgi:hypothetical protein